MPVIKAKFDGDDFVRFVQAIVDSFDFTLPGAGGGTLAEDLVGMTAEKIQQRSADAKDPDGEDWAANDPKYAAYKLDRYKIDRPGELGGQMLSRTSLEGKPEIEPDRIVMNYGTDTTPPPKSRFGVPLRESEQQATDTQKAEWFTKSGRRFYEFDDDVIDALVEVAQQHLDEYVMEANSL